MASLHGVVVKERALGAPPIELAEVSTIAVIGSAPGVVLDNKDNPYVENGKIKYNHPFLISNRESAGLDTLGADGTLPEALNTIYDQSNANVIFVIVPQPLPGGAYSEDAIKYVTGLGIASDGGTLTGDSGTTKEFDVDTFGGQTVIIFHKISDASAAALAGVRAGQTLEIKPDSGGAAISSYTIDGPYVSLADGNNDDDGYLPVTVIGSAGTLTANTSYDLAIEALTEAEVVGLLRANAVGDAEEGTGVYALYGAESVLGKKPRLICAPGVDTGSRPGGSANPLAAAMVTVAERLRGIAIIQGPSTTYAAAVEAAQDFGSDRAYLVDPKVRIADGGGNKVFDVTGMVAGLINRTDYQKGFWFSPSNQLLNNVLGTERPIDFEMGSAASQAQLLNDEGIATVVNINGGYRLWGNETQATGDREPWKFLNVRRIGDVLYDTILQEHLYAVDKPITKTYLENVAAGVNGVIRDLIAKGALIGGFCYPDGTQNTPENIAKGQVFFNVDYTPVYPAQTVSFNVLLTTRYLDDLAA